ncbi:MAG: hypothetical protein ACQESB_07510 [Elusimicrobiota bacterium]
MKKALFLIDGVHKPDNTIYSIKQLSRRHNLQVGALMWIGGTEKIESRESFSLQFKKEFKKEVVFPSSDNPENFPETELRRFLSKNKNIDKVVQLSGAPQIYRKKTVELARITVSFGLEYIAGGTVFAQESSSVKQKKPSVGIYATNKRVGKTAFGSYIGGLLSGIKEIKTPWNPVLITHSRGGPPEPPMIEIYKKALKKDSADLSRNELLSSRFKPEYLSRLLDFGLHGASDVFEDALIISAYLDAIEARGKEVPYISLLGCRRAGAGYFNEFAVSNVDKGIKKANSSPANLIIHEGSGAEHPPVQPEGVIFLIPSDVEIELLEDFPNLEKAVLFIMANCQKENSNPQKAAKIKEVLKRKNSLAPVVFTRFECEVIHPSPDLKEKRALFLTTAPDYILDRLSKQIEKRYNVKIDAALNNLDRDEDMKKAIKKAAKEKKPDYLLVEIKARGVEGAGYAQKEFSIPYYYVNNVPREVKADFSPVESNKNLDKKIIEAVSKAVNKFNFSSKSNFPLIK